MGLTVTLTLIVAGFFTLWPFRGKTQPPARRNDGQPPP
jgi:hypothetical protein